MILDSEELKRLAAGRWLDILRTVCRLTNSQLNSRVHGPCPKCEGTDRFRALDDVAETGALFCNNCFNSRNGDGFAAIQWLNGVTFQGSLKLVSEFLGNARQQSAGQQAKERQQASGGDQSKKIAVVENLPQPEAIKARDAAGKAPKKEKKIFTTVEAAADALAWGMVQSGILIEQRKPDSSWLYRNADSTDACAVKRWNLPDGRKEIRQVSAVEGGWITSAMPEPRPLYRLPDIIDAAEVWICEGEKAADAAVSLGLHATTSAGGSGAAEKSDWSTLDGKRIVILPDNDEPGLKFVAAVVALIQKQAPGASIEVKQLKADWAEIPDGGDIADWSEQFDSSDSETLQTRLRSIPNSLSEFVGDCSQKPSANKVFADKANEFIPFPLDELPAVLATFCREVSQSIGCDSSYAALTVMAVCASSIGTSRQVCLKKGWFAPCLLWTVLIGESGAQKSPPFRLAMKTVNARQADDILGFNKEIAKYNVQHANYAKESKAWKTAKEGEQPQPPEKPTRRRCIMQDSTIEALAPILQENPRGVLMGRDELSGWLAGFDKYSSKKSGASSDVPKWLEIYNCESITIDRKTGEDRDRLIYVKRPSVSITGGIQPGILARCLTDEFKENGLQSRLLMTYPPRGKKQWRDDELSEATEQAYAKMVQELFLLQGETDSAGDPRPATLTLTTEARALFKAYVDTTGDEQASLHGHAASQWSKLEEIPGRLAVVIHCVRQVTTGVDDFWKIDGTTMRSAIALAEWFKTETLRIGRVLSESESLRETRHLAAWIQSRGGRITARDLCKQRRDIVSTDEAELKLIKLVELEFGTWQSVHKSREFLLNQQASSAFDT